MYRSFPLAISYSIVYLDHKRTPFCTPSTLQQQCTFPRWPHALQVAFWLGCCWSPRRPWTFERNYRLASTPKVKRWGLRERFVAENRMGNWTAELNLDISASTLLWGCYHKHVQHFLRLVRPVPLHAVPRCGSRREFRLRHQNHWPLCDAR